mgnify:CR=1 FL=1
MKPRKIIINPRNSNGNGIQVELKEERSKMVWMYLLGCLNANFTGDVDHTVTWNSNTFGMKAFQLTREASGYVKIGDRRALRDNYEDLKSNG